MKFTKMHGIGNDFVVLDCLNEAIPEERIADLARTMNDRRFGIGGDGLILVLPSRVADFRMRMLNPDGSEAEMCGNGIRCFARYVFDRRITTEAQIRIDTLAGVKAVRVQSRGGKAETVRVDMGAPRLRRSEIPMRGDDADRVVAEPLRVERKRYEITAVSMGNPHVIVFVPDVATVEVAKIGPQIETHRLFPQRTNVHFVQVLSSTEITVRTWERGAGMTMACGTGACASLVASCLNDVTGRRATVHLPGGDLLVEWVGDGRVMMTGPAEEVFEGDFPA